MAKQNKPTKSELEILSILWEKETATVREVYEIISERKPTAYTTVLKLMQIMFEKGLVKRDDSNRAHIFSAKQPQEQTQKNLVSDFWKKRFAVRL